MITKDNIREFITSHQRHYKVSSQPIFDILLFENAEKEVMGKTGKKLGFRDLGCTDNVGYYYNLDDAISALNENACDMRETVYDAAFILCRFPGLYQNSGTEGRMYFRWDPEREGYFQAEEPKIFEHIAY